MCVCLCVRGSPVLVVTSASAVAKSIKNTKQIYNNSNSTNLFILSVQ